MLTAGEAGLDTRWFCDLELSYNDKGSGGEQDVQFYQPILPAGYSMIGGYAQGNHHRASSCVLGVRPVSNESSVLIRPASLWKQVWTDENSGAFMDGSIWHPETDHPDYVCLGSVAKQGYSRPNMPYYACVHQCLVEEIPVTGYIWSDKGTGASTDVSIYRLQNSNGFYAVPSHNAPRSLRDIRRNTVCSSN